MFKVESTKLSSILSIFAALLLNARSEETTVSSVPLERNATALERDTSGPITEILRLPEAFDADRVLEEHARHFMCLPLLRIFNLELHQPLAPGEHIALTGAHKNLGEWQLERSIELRSLDGKRLEWLAKMPICANERISYRYFIYTLDAQRQKRIRVWEGQLHPRIMESYQIYRQPGTDHFGETASTAIDIGGRESTWLRYDRLIELKFIWKRQLKIQRHKERKVRLKLEALGQKTHDSLIEVSRYAYNRSRFRQQPYAGVLYNFASDSEDVIVFRIMEPLRVHRSYKLRLFSMARKEIGYVSIFHVDLRWSQGILRLPLHAASNGFGIGQVTLPYLIVQPLPQAAALDMRGSYQHFWPLNWPTMHVGNRGSGRSYYDAEAPFVENTIKSFLHIHKQNGDMVKLELQLTKDYVPVVWHDDGFYTAPAGRRVQSILDLDYMLISEMNYQQLKSRRVFMLKSPATGIEEYTLYNKHQKEDLERLFPRLSEVYRRLPKSLGLIIDVKWPQLFLDDIVRPNSVVGSSPNTLDMNRYVNRLIGLTARYGCGRPLIFTSVNADLCTMLRYKQNIYPVMFMTASQSNPFKDLRTQSFAKAVNFAQSEFLLGTAAHVYEFFERPQKLKLGLDLTQVVFLWGEELQNSKIIRKFQKLHVTGLIYDRMDLHRPQKPRFAFFEAKELKELFGRQCPSSLSNATRTTDTRVSGSGRKRRKFINIHI